ncbi:amidohydrolase [Schnuerera sp. xch1]|uniref:amidohydrolase n=1 Tax=Schnuerera sp. xch1 TaxID=2874283 RepID=UPI001CBC4006|nr:amidohydrolase [Schnuerera sp. xch1]MBZ2175016.1 amidohydrolase [Schnuerera sp. xch1]
MLKKKKLQMYITIFLLALLTYTMISPLSVVAANVSKNVFDKNQQIAIDFLDNSTTQKKLAEICDAIWSYAELGLEEYNTSNLLINYLEKEGFEVEKGVAKMPTAFVATYSNGDGPTIGVLGELDALPALSQEAGSTEHSPVTEVNGASAPGHGCTHNTMCTAAAGTVVAVKNAMDEGGFTGTIKMFASPAEETVISRPFMVYSGLFDDVDVVIDNHGGGSFGASYGVSSNTEWSFSVTFYGQTAHSAGSPWLGKSALDAVEIMNMNTEFLREHLHYTSRMHYVILEGGEAPNVVPDRATTWYYVRNSDELIKSDFEKVLNCAKAAALATDTKMEITPYTAIHQCYRNEGVANILQNNILKVGMPEWTGDEQKFAKELQKSIGASEVSLYDNSRLEDKPRGPSPVFVGGGSSDIGEVSLVVPLSTLNFPSSVPGAIGHHWSTSATTGTTIAHKGLIAGAKVMAASAIELMTDEDKLAGIKDEFKEMQEEYFYNYKNDGEKLILDENGNAQFESYLPYLFDRSGEYKYDPDSSKFFIPEGKPVVPPLGFLAEQMAKYRPEMSKYYKTPKWYDGPPIITE